MAFNSFMCLPFSFMERADIFSTPNECLTGHLAPLIPAGLEDYSCGNGKGRGKGQRKGKRISTMNANISTRDTLD